MEPVKISAHINSKQTSVVAGNWRQSQPVKSFVQCNSRQVIRKLEAVAAGWKQLKEFTNVPVVCLVRKKEKAGIMLAYVHVVELLP